MKYKLLRIERDEEGNYELQENDIPLNAVFEIEYTHEGNHHRILNNPVLYALRSVS